jgi:hypothetical protein
MWCLGIVFVQKAIFASVPGTECDTCAKGISDIRAEVGVSGAPGLWPDHKMLKLEIVVEFNLFLGRNHSIPVPGQ